MSDPEQVVVFGPGSIVGPFLMSRLAGAGWAGSCLSRTPPEERCAFPGQFDWTRFDVTAPGDWRAPDRCVVISLLPLWLVPPLLPHLRQARQVIAFGSTSIFGKADSSDPEEQRVARSLAAAEADIERFCGDTGVRWTILRPTMTYDPGKDNNVSAIARTIRRTGIFPVAWPGRGLRQPVHADDLAAAAVAAIDNPRAFDAAFDLPGGETLTYRDMVRRIFDGLGRPPLILPVPGAVLRLALTAAHRFGGGRYSPELVGRMNRDLAFDGSAAKTALDYQPRPFRPEFKGASPS